MQILSLFASKTNSKLLTLVVLLFIIVSMLGSCAKKEEEPVIEYKDKELINDFALGWQERHDLETQAEAEKSSKKQQELLLKGCDAELSHVEKYSNEQFKKQSLKDLLTEYIACLNENKEALQLYASDYDKYLSMVQSANNDRRRILTRLVSDYGLEVEENYKDAFSEHLTNAEVSGIYSKQQETVDALVTEIKFEKEPDDYYGEKYHTYSANVENTTGISFEQLNIKVKLYDSEGTVVGTENVYIEKFMAESTEKLEFSTDAEFEKMEVSCDSWKEVK